MSFSSFIQPMNILPVRLHRIFTRGIEKTYDALSMVIATVYLMPNVTVIDLSSFCAGTSKPFHYAHPITDRLILALLKCYSYFHPKKMAGLNGSQLINSMLLLWFRPHERRLQQHSRPPAGQVPESPGGLCVLFMDLGFSLFDGNAWPYSRSHALLVFTLPSAASGANVGVDGSGLQRPDHVHS